MIRFRLIIQNNDDGYVLCDFASQADYEHAARALDDLVNEARKFLMMVAIHSLNTERKEQP